MDLIAILAEVELLDGLTAEQLEAVAALCQPRTLDAGELLTAQGDQPDELYIICEGYVEVALESEGGGRRAIVNLGKGQLVGEMGLVDHGPRSATVVTVDRNTLVQVIERSALEDLCEAQPELGYVLMRNLAADLSFKLRHRHLASR
jgi:CRP/FNR family cyclic AMP-dependent transcriptional regulator